MLHLLNNPCPIQASRKYLILSSILAGIFIWIFLQVFQPFGIHSISGTHKPLLLAGYGAVTSGVMLLLGSLLYFYFRQHPQREQEWTVGRQILYIMLLLATIAIANFFYSIWAGIIHFSLPGFVFYVGATLVIGLFPTVALTVLGYIRHLHKHIAVANATNLHLEQHPARPSISKHAGALILEGENKDERLEILPEKLLYLAAAGNYVEVVWLQDEKLQKTLLRSSLSRLEEQLKLFSSIQRSHRSYLINLLWVEKVSGNAQGYQLHLKDTALAVPVGRSYAATILTSIGH